MKYYFFAELSACVELDDADFAYLKEQAKRHYDHEVKASVEVGGFLYGLTNRRDFSNGEDKELTLPSRYMQLCLKALEFDTEEPGRRIYARLRGVALEMQHRNNQLNESLKL